MMATLHHAGIGHASASGDVQDTAAQWQELANWQIERRIIKRRADVPNIGFM